MPASAEMPRLHGRVAAGGLILRWLLPGATAIVLLGLTLVGLFTPAWVHLALSLSGGDDWLGSAALARELSDRTIAELLLGPATFAFAGPDGTPFYSADEAAHLLDVRLVLGAFVALFAVSLGALAWAIWRHGRQPATWRAISRGGAALALTLLTLGAVAAIAFGAAFELFHRLLFPGGNWAFPADSNLIRLYPLAFWQLSAAALGAIGIAAGGTTWLIAGRRARRLAARPEARAR